MQHGDSAEELPVRTVLWAAGMAASPLGRMVAASTRAELDRSGRVKVAADLGFARFSGWPAWFAWIFVHISHLIGFGNKALVMFQWALNYVTRNRGARLITGRDTEPSVNQQEKTDADG